MTIIDWPLAERPREKLLSKCAIALSDAELLAVFLRTGIRGKTAVDLGRELIEQFAGIKGLLNASRREFTATRGMGDAKYAALQAVFELSRRAMMEPLQRDGALTSPEDTQAYLLHLLGHEHREVFWCLFLDNQHRVIASEALFYGTIDQANVYPREVIKACLQHNAAAVIFAHNHPSGAAEPSQADKKITQRLAKALALIDIRMLDHIIVAGSSTVSMAKLGMI
ncbi:MAG: DNA repair protein RadC [Pseudomonadales bacterium]|nr:DNA repair protein RadC [Pseudomonadales bacterium]